MLGISYDSKNQNGIVFNDTYTWGALYTGEEHRPNLTFEYDSFECHEAFERFTYTDIDGNEVKLTNDQINEILEIARAWVQPEGQEGNPTIEQMKDRYKALINQERDQAISKGVTYNGNVFDSDPLSAQRILGTIVEIDNTTITEKNWITKDNVEVTLTLDDFVGIGAEISNREGQCVFTARYFKDQMLAATTKADVEAIKNQAVTEIRAL